MITLEHMKEELSRAYLMAVIAKSGMMFSKSELDYGIDGSVKDVEIREEDGKKRHVETGFSIDIQLKATVNTTIENGYISYKLDVKNYNDLIKENIMIPRILCLYILPQDNEEWLTVTDDYGMLKKGMWWFSLKGENASTNKATVTIKIPYVQQLTPKVLRELMEKAKRGEDL